MVRSHAARPLDEHYPAPIRRTASLLSLFALAVAGCGGDDEAGGGEERGGGNVVSMRDLQFQPRELTVEVGQRVTWRNDDTAPHNVVTQDGSGPKSDVFGQGKSYSFTPEQAGEIAYVCTIHPGMEGTLTVSGG